MVPAFPPITDGEAASAAAMWKAVEPIHTMIYFARETVEAFLRLGLIGRWRGLVAARLAPLGDVPAAAAANIFFGFHPGRLEAVLPDVWSFVRPEDVTTARTMAADAALRRLLGTRVLGSSEMKQGAESAHRAVAGIKGGPLTTAYTALDWPTQSHLVLWQAVTILGECRSEAQVAALRAADLDGCQASVAVAAAGLVAREDLQARRGWSDNQWKAAVVSLWERGWLDTVGRLTSLGWEGWRGVESEAEALASIPWSNLGYAAARLRRSAATWSDLVTRHGGHPFPQSARILL